MLAPIENPDLGQLNYPVYVTPIFKAKDTKVVLYGNVIFAYILKDDRYMWYDCMSVDNWTSKFCRLTYEERLQLLRHTLTEVADFSKHIDAPRRADNPVELLDLYKEALTNDCEGVKIYDVDGKYEFDDNIVTDKYWELMPKEIVVE